MAKLEPPLRIVGGAFVIVIQFASAGKMVGTSNIATITATYEIFGILPSKIVGIFLT
ncbi:Uncharacterised protein [uncultured archaeon]|nr:Uncharacterised protein [uncultured archaeon]